MLRFRKTQTAKEQWGNFNAQTLNVTAQKAVKGGNGSSGDGDDIIIHEDIIEG